MQSAQAQPAADHNITISAKMRSGPLPDPQTLAEYETLLEGSANRIFQLAEKDQAFVHEAFFRDQRNAHRVTVLGQIFGFVLGTVGIVGAVWLISLDRSLTGLAVFAGALSTLIFAAAWGRKVDAAKPEGEKKPG